MRTAVGVSYQFAADAFRAASGLRPRAPNDRAGSKEHAQHKAQDEQQNDDAREPDERTHDVLKTAASGTGARRIRPALVSALQAVKARLGARRLGSVGRVLDHFFP